MRLCIVVIVTTALCKECGVLGVCSSCAEVWEAEEDLEFEEELW